MSTGYQIEEQDALHYVTLQMLRWVDLFTRKVHRVIVIISKSLLDKRIIDDYHTF